MSNSHPHSHLVHTHCGTCGTELNFRSTAETIAVDVCSNCHPAYTGVERRSVRGDRIARFNQRRALAAA